MKNVIRTVSGIAALSFILSSWSEATADFGLRIDNANAQLVGSYFQVDGYFTNTGAGSPAQIQQLFLSLVIKPADNVSPIDGVQFAGIVNGTSNPLFNNPQIFGTPSNLTFFGSLLNGAPVTPVDETKAFTLLLQSYLNNPVDVKVEFQAALYVDVVSGDNTIPVQIEETNLISPGSFTISAVPEPSTCVLSALGFGAMALGKRWSKRKQKA